MIDCDVLIVGGGPAGSSCAWALRDSGLDVLVLDRADFPRDKTCAGWVTPPVWEMLRIDRDEYAVGRTLQPITGFCTGMLGGGSVETHYNEVVSYGIRRCEFDHYLLQRSGARLMTGHAVHDIERDGENWIVNQQFRAPAVVGAGGNFCPVARFLGRSASPHSLVRAQEVEYEVDPQELGTLQVSGAVPELFFCDDLNGYGWCFRKQNFLNIGLGHTDPDRMKADLDKLCRRLLSSSRIAQPVPVRRHGHAYRLYRANGKPPIAEGILLIGDAAGLADARSGEGIRQAVESGLAAARTLWEADGDYRPDRLQSYVDWLRGRYDQSAASAQSGRVMSWLRSASARALLRSRWFSRHVLLDRWFLHRHDPSEAGVAG